MAAEADIIICPKPTAESQEDFTSAAHAQIQSLDNLDMESEDIELEGCDTMQTEEDLMADNVHTFINMAHLQKAFNVLENPLDDREKVHVEVEPGKRLLLLDMDETLLHAATLNDIFEQEIYGPNAQPTFFTSFRDKESLIEIGVFLRPCL